MAQTAFPDVAWPGHPGMVSVAELIRRVAAPVDPAGHRPDPTDQVPVENLLRREGRDTGPLPAGRARPSELKQPVASPPRPARRRVARIALAAGAVVAAGSVIAGGVWLSQRGQPVAGVDEGRYAGQGVPDRLPGASVAPDAPDGAGASAAALLPPAFPDLAGAAAGRTIPVTGGAPVTPAGASGAPSSAATPSQAGGGAPSTGSGGTAAQQTAEPTSAAAGPLGNTVNGVSPALGNAAAPVTGALDGAVAGLLG